MFQNLSIIASNNLAILQQSSNLQYIFKHFINLSVYSYICISLYRSILLLIYLSVKPCIHLTSYLANNVLIYLSSNKYKFLYTIFTLFLHMIGHIIATVCWTSWDSRACRTFVTAPSCKILLLLFLVQSQLDRNVDRHRK